MHVFIDTNILLNFFYFTKDELDALNNVFASHEHGSATVYLTEQVSNEFRRNREMKIREALKKFKEINFALQAPSFLKGYEEYEKLRKLSADLQENQASILKNAMKDILEGNLVADRLIGSILKISKIREVSQKIFEEASKRVSLGNPPGKNGSLGDAVNWIILLDSVPTGADLHIISEDNDFYSAINEQGPHPFLAEEWRQKKKASLRVYRTLSAFMKEHFDGVAFSFDKDKDALIEDLKHCGSFAETHFVVSKLEKYSYFSAKEVSRILDAAAANGQFGGIITDWDVSDFLNRVAVPQRENLTPAHKEILKQVIDEKRGRVVAEGVS